LDVIQSLCSGGFDGLFVFLNEEQMARISPYFPLAHVIQRIEDRRADSGIGYVIRNVLQWKDAPKTYGPHETLYNLFSRWSRLDVFNRAFAALSGEGRETQRIMSDSSHQRRVAWRQALYMSK
jgi:transposase